MVLQFPGTDVRADHLTSAQTGQRSHARPPRRQTTATGPTSLLRKLVVLERTRPGILGVFERLADRQLARQAEDDLENEGGGE